MGKERKELVSDSWAHLLPPQNDKVCEENLEMFWYWIAERHNIWRNRFVHKKKAPWTKDPILRDFNFCNVYRELDRNSIWITENVLTKDFKDEKDKLFALLITRSFNNPLTFERCGIPSYYGFNPKVWKLKVQKKMIEKGDNPFTQAYLINSASFPGVPKYEAYCLHVCKEIHEKVPEILKIAKKGKSPEELIKKLMEIHGVAGFIAYEFYCDMDGWEGFMKWDLNDYVNTGPGCRVGIRLIFPEKSWNNKDTTKAMEHLRDNQEKYLKKFGLKLKPLDNKYGRLTLREIEHSLCELQKYFKMKHGVGKPRRKFKPIK